MTPKDLHALIEDNLFRLHVLGLWAVRQALERPKPACDPDEKKEWRVEGEKVNKDDADDTL